MGAGDWLQGWVLGLAYWFLLTRTGELGLDWLLGFHCRTEVASARESGRYSGMSDALILQVERIRAMTADEKLRVSHDLWEEAWSIAAAGIRARHPDWSDAEIAAGVRALMRESAS